jgi:hypothetical protein|tara:strand:- start:286 stop:618 length:333 start_codon:yes stop_codon:yes gene_type:complete
MRKFKIEVMGLKRFILFCIFLVCAFFTFVLAADLTQENIMPIAAAWVDGADLDVTDIIGFMRGEIALQNFIGTVPGMRYEGTTAAGIEDGKLVYGAKIGSKWYVVEDVMS